MMAEGMDDGEFWLPAEFLADDFLEGKGNSSGGGGGGACYPCEIPGEGFFSNLGSPVESATETESDEEDYLAGLTRQMTHAFLQDDDDPIVLGRGYPKIQAMSRSPQSTLCDLGIWAGSNRGSPNGPSQVSSPPSTPLEQHKDASWDLLAAAAGQVVQMRLSDRAQQQKLQARGLLGPMVKPSIPIPAPPENPSAGFYTRPVLTPQQLQAERFYQLKQQQLMKQHISASWGRHQSKGNGGGGGGGAYREGRCGGRPLGLPSSAWPALQRRQHQQPQPQPGSGMRAVFLTGSGTRRESVGTGVFLPRRPDNPTELRKKPACSTVLLPDRVIRALNMNPDDMGTHHRFPGAGGYLDHHDAMIARGDALLSQHNRNHHRQPTAAAANHELRLPAEWTY